MLVVANFQATMSSGPAAAKSSCLPFSCFQLVEGYILVAWFTLNKIIDCLIECMIGKHINSRRMISLHQEYLQSAKSKEW